jgi:hypothetical protein
MKANKIIFTFLAGILVACSQEVNTAVPKKINPDNKASVSKSNNRELLYDYFQVKKAGC